MLVELNSGNFCMVMALSRERSLAIPNESRFCVFEALWHRTRISFFLLAKCLKWKCHNCLLIQLCRNNQIFCAHWVSDCPFKLQMCESTIFQIKPAHVFSSVQGQPGSLKIILVTLLTRWQVQCSPLYPCSYWSLFCCSFIRTGGCLS